MLFNVIFVQPMNNGREFLQHMNNGQVLKLFYLRVNYDIF